VVEDSVQHTEARLREGLETVLELAPGTLAGTARLEDLFKPDRRRDLWPAWEKVSGVRLPSLDHSLTTKMGWFAGGFVAALFALAVLRTMGVHVPGSMMAGGVAGVLLGAAGLRFLGGKPIGFPAGVHTIADLAIRVEMRRS
jgi:hypothetical protein